MLFRCVVLLLLISKMSLAQPCSDLIGTTTDGNWKPIFAFKESIEVTASKGKKAISIYGCIIDSTMVVIFTVTGNDPCIQQHTGIHVNFTDGTKLEMENSYPDNCENKSMACFARELNNREQFEILKNKQIETLKIWTSQSEFVKADIPEQVALKLSKSLKCLSNYVGVKPSPETTSVYGSDMSKRTDPADTSKRFVVVEQQPEFEGGYGALMQFIMDNLRIPASAAKDKVYGTVIVTFIIDRDGSVKEAAIREGIREDLNAEALRVVNLMPKWKPGKQQGKPVTVRFNIPIKFGRQTKL